MSKAEQRALEAYPVQIDPTACDCDINEVSREIYLLGYEQAQKDLSLTWEDIQTIDNIVVDMAHNTDWPLRGQEVFYTEVLNRFNKSKEKK